MTGSAVGDNEYRASGISVNGQKSNLRLLRNPDGTMVRAEMTYAADQAETADLLASTVLDSLTLQ